LADAVAAVIVVAVVAYSSAREARCGGFGDFRAGDGVEKASSREEPPQRGSWKRAMLEASLSSSVFFTTPWPGMFVPVINSN
jgi:hypothetical protein